MVKYMMENAVQLKYLVQSIKETVTKTQNAKETLSVERTIVLHLFHQPQTAVNHLLVQARKLNINHLSFYFYCNKCFTVQSI